jgi:hypothetical protein
MATRPRREDESGDHEVVELAALADGSLSRARRAALEERVAASSGLAALLAEQERAVALTRAAAGEVEAPAGLRARIDAQRRPRRSRAPWTYVLAGAAATAVLALVGIGIAVLASSSSSARFHANLAATGLAPGVTGEATFYKKESGWRIELDAASLPRLADGSYYQAWLRNGAGVLVPVGTFNDGQNVVLWAGVSPEQFRTLTVTQERADGNQGSSGQKVLVGSVSQSG